METIQVLQRGKLRGRVLENGALCIESWQIDPSNHVVLALRDHSYDPYVVWTATADGICSRGDYCHTLDEALQIGRKRAGW